ncbi:U1 small nuclear ribonucleoprotein C isoform X2 [Jatropha curcas]|uniref:U1 small nuclear ribonucleoprotein C isoform X2 n=1 Tax=Jatropha curcas TaxID=180498 RepID=UPI0005FBA4A7|nr:U1 small nuclear ribonucleoprotein C isoform X2 [Jatropha curcas]
MPRYYCDYCDTYLTHDSPSVRKQHNAGYKHKTNVRNYYQQFEEQQTQSLIDQRIKEHLGQNAAFQQVGAAYNQHLLAQRPHLPTPIMPMPVPGFRPPVFPRPVPGYVSGPTPQMVAPPGASSLSGQVNGIQRPPMIIPPSMAPGSTAAPSGAPSMVPPPTYQTNSAVSTNGGFDSFANTPAPGANH